MRKQFFKRSVQGISIIVLLVIVCIGFVIISIQETMSGTKVAEAVIFYAICLVLLFVIGEVISPDFKYWIRVEDGYIIFEKNETDHRPILRRYSVIRQTRKKIVLEDERGTIISIAYNAEVLEFLKQVRIE